MSTAETTKPLEHTRIDLHDPKVGNGFLNMVPKVLVINRTSSNLKMTSSKKK